jgi:Fe-S-cluster containining protein
MRKEKTLEKKDRLGYSLYNGIFVGLMAEHFYSGGLYFSCTRCSSCCRHESGFVYISESDLTKLCRYCNLERDEFIAVYCRWVPYEGGEQALSLKEKHNFDCVFWENGCTVYGARPVQCVTYPFWTHLVCSEQAWSAGAAHCPGMKQGLNKAGIFRDMNTIDASLTQYKNNNPIIKKNEA